MALDLLWTDIVDSIYAFAGGALPLLRAPDEGSLLCLDDCPVNAARRRKLGYLRMDSVHLA